MSTQFVLMSPLIDVFRISWHVTRSLSDFRLTARFLPFSPEASLLLAPGEPPSFVFAAIRGGFSSLSLGTLFGMRVHRLAYPAAAALPKYSRSPATLRFVALHQEKIIKNRLEVSKPDRLLAQITTPLRPLHVKLTQKIPFNPRGKISSPYIVVQIIIQATFSAPYPVVKRQ